MKTIKNKEILVGADFAGFPLKEVSVYKDETFLYLEETLLYCVLSGVNVR